MEELPTSLLTQQEQAKPRTGEELEAFGKHAANLYLAGTCGTLSEAVVEAVKTASLSPEQVKRVVEFTNTNAYLSKFASEGPTHKVINFDGGPASFPDVIRDLNDGGEPVFNKAASLDDYFLPPPALVESEGDSEKLAAAFQAEDVVIPFEEPLREAADMKDKVAGIYDQAQHEIDQLETRYLDLCDMLFKQVKQASLEGVPLGHTLQVLGTAAPSAEYIKVAFEFLSPKLVENQVFRSQVEVVDSIQKTAGVGLVNPDHPMVGVFSDFCDTLHKLAATRAVQVEAAEQLDILSTFMKKASKASEAGEAAGKVLGYIPKAFRAVSDATARASVPVEEFVSKAIGPNAGTAAGLAVKYAPHAATALAGEEAYQRAKNQPALRAASNFALSRVPYTHQNLVRQYNLQMGQS
jgi:hypothetical protein